MLPSQQNQPIKALQLITEVETALQQQTTLLANGIKFNIKQGRPALAILKELSEMAVDNRKAIHDMLGTPLTASIITYIEKLQTITNS